MDLRTLNTGYKVDSYLVTTHYERFMRDLDETVKKVASETRAKIAKKMKGKS